MKQLKFSPKLVDLILSREKTTTWRLWDEKGLVVGDMLEFLESGSNKPFALAEITSVTDNTFDSLTEEDKAGHEKFESDEEMLATYSKYYGKKVDGQTKLKIVKFELLTTGEYVEATCPYLVDDKCSIYENRMKCCRNHPQDTGYCAESDCLIHGIERNTEESSKLCLECGAKCCKRILVPAGQDVTKKFIKSWLDIDCKTCGELFSPMLKKSKERQRVK